MRIRSTKFRSTFCKRLKCSHTRVQNYCVEFPTNAFYFSLVIIISPAQQEIKPKCRSGNTINLRFIRMCAANFSRIIVSINAIFFPFCYFPCAEPEQEEDFFYERSSRGNPILVLNHNRYVRNRESTKRVFWRCTKYYQTAVRCPGSLAVTKHTDADVLCVSTTRQHNPTCDSIRAQDESKSIKNKKR